MYALHVYEGGSTTAQLIISSSLAPLKAVRVPRLELLGTLIATNKTRLLTTQDAYTRRNDLLDGQFGRGLLDPGTK